MRAVVFLPISGQLDESNIGVGDDAADRPRCNEVDDDSDEFSLKDVDSNELSCKRRQRRPIFGTTSQVSSGGTEELGAKTEELEGNMEEYLEGKMKEDGGGKSGSDDGGIPGSEDGGTERRFKQ